MSSDTEPDNDLAELVRLREENCRLKALLAENGIGYQTHPPAVVRPNSAAEMSQAAKVELFRSLFRGREDVFAVRWEARDGRTGFAPANRITDEADLPPDKVAFLMRTPAWCRRRAAEVGPSTAGLVDALLQQGGLTRLREVQALLHLLDKYDAARLEASCALALTADGRMKTVRNILAADLDRRQLELLPATSAGAFLHGAEAIVGEGGR